MLGKVVLSAVAMLALAGSAMAQDKTTLRFANIMDAAGIERFKPVLDEFHAAYPDIEVKMEGVAGSGSAVYPDLLRTSMASGDPPDVFFMWGGTVGTPFIRAGFVRPLNDLYESEGWDERFPPWIVKAMSVDDKIYGVPVNGRGMGFWFRKATLEERDIAVPKTFEELEAACARLKEDGVYCASVGGKYGWHTMRLTDYFIEQACGPEIHDGLNALTEDWSQECVVESYATMRRWIDNGWLVPDFLNVEPNDARFPVYQGNAAMIFEGPWFEGALRNDEMQFADYDFFLPPTGHAEERYSAFPELYMISAGAKNTDAAVKFLDFITDPEVQKRNPTVFSGSVSVGFRPDCETSPFACRWLEITTSDRPSYPPTDQAFEKELMDSFFEIQDNVIAGRLTPADAAKLMQERATAWKQANPAA